MSEDKKPSGLRLLWNGLRGAPKAFRASFVRHGSVDSPRTRLQVISSNFFLHIHSTRTHRHSLKWYYSFGLGVMTTVSMFTLFVTGLLLMLYYKPSTQLAYVSLPRYVGQPLS